MSRAEKWGRTSVAAIGHAPRAPFRGSRQDSAAARLAEGVPSALPPLLILQVRPRRPRPIVLNSGRCVILDFNPKP